MAQASFGPQNLHVESFRLLSGHKIPAVGLGTWKADDEAYKSVFTAVVEVIFHNISVSCTKLMVEQSLFYFSRCAPKVFTLGLGLLILTVQFRFLVSSSYTLSTVYLHVEC